jgi:uncharacterized integral membrane protein
VTWSATTLQALASTAIWGILMVWMFDWPRETILMPMVVFGLIMFALLAVSKLVRDRRSDR